MIGQRINIFIFSHSQLPKWPDAFVYMCSLVTKEEFSGICCPAAFRSNIFFLTATCHHTTHATPLHFVCLFFCMSITPYESYGTFLQRNLLCWRASGKPPTTVPKWAELSWVAISEHRNPLSGPSGSCYCSSTLVGSTFFMLMCTLTTKRRKSLKNDFAN